MDQHGQRSPKRLALDLGDRDKQFLTKQIQESIEHEEVEPVDSELIQLDVIDCEEVDHVGRTLGEMVFSINLCVDEIFQHLDVVDFLKCRQIFTGCQAIATRRTQKSNRQIEFGRINDRFFKKGCDSLSLEMLTELVATPPGFPVTKFSFRGGNLKNPDAQKFFSRFGENITKLKIRVADDFNDPIECEDGFVCQMTNSKVIGNILTELVPNLKELTLDTRFSRIHDWTGYNDLLFSPDQEVVLSHLEIIKYSSRCPTNDMVLRQLLLSSPNVSNFYTVDSYLIQRALEVVESGKVHCLTQLVFPGGTKWLDIFITVAGYQPKLKYLGIHCLINYTRKPVFWDRLSVVFSDLLKYSSDTLVRLTKVHSFGFLCHLKLPILRNVRELEFTILDPKVFGNVPHHDYLYSFLPQGATFTVNFPRLTKMSVSHQGEKGSMKYVPELLWNLCFPKTETVESVKEVDLRGVSYSTVWIELLANMFPNLERLSVSKVRDFPTTFIVIFTKLKKLKSLKIGIGWGSSKKVQSNLDSSFTGLSFEQCREFRNVEPLKLKNGAEGCMENSTMSMVEMTELETLNVSCFLSKNGKFESKPIFLSHVTGVLIFDKMSSLKNVKIRIRCYNKNSIFIQGIREPLISLGHKVEVAR